ncbi:TIGR00341 family protein [Porphyromonas sp.]
MNLFKRIRIFFNLRSDLEQEQAIIEEITRGVSFRGANLWVLIVAIFIASLGLNVNSTAVIIGAMLISPLMGPIIGMGLAVGINDLELLKRALKNFSVATLISVLTAMLYFLISPLEEAQSELLARTTPTIYDVLIAFFGGAAGIIALSTRGRGGNVIPGVAIATALMPPLCTAGYGLATGQLTFFFGAFYLFFINTVFISLATIIGVRLMGFRHHEVLAPDRAKRAHHILTLIIVATTLPALLMTADIIRTSIFENNLRRFIAAELAQSGTQILSSGRDATTKELRIVAIGRAITDDQQQAATARMEQYGLGGYQLSVIQGGASDSLLSLSSQLAQHTYTQEREKQKLLELSSDNASLTQRLEAYTRCEALATELRPELAVLFPAVHSLSLSRAVEVQRDTTATLHFVMAAFALEEGARWSAEDARRFEAWLKTRLSGDSVVLLPRTKVFSSMKAH